MSHHIHHYLLSGWFQEAPNWCPCVCPYPHSTVYYQHSSWNNPLQYKSGHIQPLLRTLWELPSPSLQWPIRSLYDLASIASPGSPTTVSPSSPPLQIHWAPCYFLLIPGTFLPHGLCICYSLVLERSSPGFQHGLLFHILQYLVTCHFFSKAFSTHHI